MKVIPAMVVALAGALGLAWWWTATSVQGYGAGERHSCLPGGNTVALADSHPGMVWVPAGSFDFGDQVYAEERPVRRKTVSGFWMDRTEVTNRQFAAFVAATGYVTTAERQVDWRKHPNLPPDMRQPGAVVFTPPQSSASASKALEWWRYTPGASWRHPGGPQTDLQGREEFPVVNVTYEDATAYAQWMGRELPTEIQWEWAARAGNSAAPGLKEQPAQANTWQGLFPVLNSADDGFVGLAPVGCYPANAFGLHDMIGNVWELTADMYRPGHGDEAPDASDAPSRVPMALRAASNGTRVIKGGSYLCAPNYCLRYRPGARQPQEEDLAVSHLGFRTVTKGQGS